MAFLKESENMEGVLDLWIAPTGGGAAVRLVSGADLDQGRRQSSGDEFDRRERLRIRESGVVEYVWNGDGRAILIPANGDLWMVDVGARALKRLTQTDAPEIDPKFSPLGNFVSFVRNRNLHIFDLRTNQERRITPDDPEGVSWGLAEFVAQEEMRRPTGYWWAPDERNIVVGRVDERGVDRVPRVLFGPSGISTEAQHYPRAGRPNAKVDLYIADPATQRLKPIELGHADHYIARIDWATDGGTFFVQRQSRDQKTLDLVAVDAATAATRILVTERSPHWVEITDDFKPLSNGNFLWTSERSGNRHIYLFDRSGKAIRQVTAGPWPVERIEAVDEKRRIVFFGASKETPIERQLYSASYAQRSEPRAITTGKGWWRISMPEAASSFIGTYSDPSTPPHTALYAADGRLIRWIERNPLDATHPYWPYVDKLPEPRYGTIKADDGAILHYQLQTPPEFDPSRRYPVIISVYGGPVVQTVRRQWGNPTDRLLLDRGYIVFRLDNRGSANRSVAFKTAIAGRLGQAEVRDQLAGIKFLSGLPYVDGGRIGVTGWSYGGFMTLMLLTEPDTPVAAGAAGAAPSDWRLYDTHYAERFLGTPEGNPVNYEAVDIVRRLDRLGGRLLLLHGMSDDNVVFENAMRVATALQARSVPFEEMYYPGEAHLLRGNSKQLHLWRTYVDFFDRALAMPGRHPETLEE